MADTPRTAPKTQAAKKKQHSPAWAAARKARKARRATERDGKN